MSSSTPLADSISRTTFSLGESATSVYEAEAKEAAKKAQIKKDASEQLLKQSINSTVSAKSSQLGSTVTDIISGVVKGNTTDLLGGPVDLVNFALSSVGVPTSSKPFMGADWWRDKTGQQAQSKDSLTETVASFISPAGLVKAGAAGAIKLGALTKAGVSIGMAGTLAQPSVTKLPAEIFKATETISPSGVSGVNSVSEVSDILSSLDRTKLIGTPKGARFGTLAPEATSGTTGSEAILNTRSLPRSADATAPRFDPHAKLTVKDILPGASPELHSIPVVFDPTLYDKGKYTTGLEKPKDFYAAPAYRGITLGYFSSSQQAQAELLKQLEAASPTGTHTLKASGTSSYLSK